MTTDLELDPLEVIALYGYRFKIEVSFKQAKYTLGAQAYNLWMLDMNPIRKGLGDQHPHHETSVYRAHVKRKIDAYHRFAQLACVAQGLLVHLAVHFPTQVWSRFRSWMRTMKPQDVPTEHVVAEALRCDLPEFQLRAPIRNILGTS